MLGLKLLPFLEVVVLLFTALAHCELNHIGDFFYQACKKRE